MRLHVSLCLYVIDLFDFYMCFILFYVSLIMVFACVLEKYPLDTTDELDTTTDELDN